MHLTKLHGSVYVPVVNAQVNRYLVKTSGTRHWSIMSSTEVTQCSAMLLTSLPDDWDPDHHASEVHIWNN